MSNIQKIVKKYNIVIIITLLIIFFVIYMMLNKKNTVIHLIKRDNNTNEVYLKGAVKNEGKYYIKKNSTVKELLNDAGGTTIEADLSKINLDKELKEGEIIEVPIKERYKEIEDENQDKDKNEKININTADTTALTSLEGIGVKTAEKIIEYRKNNKFQNIEDIKNVKGIGDKKYETIKNDICI